MKVISASINGNIVNVKTASCEITYVEAKSSESVTLMAAIYLSIVK